MTQLLISIGSSAEPIKYRYDVNRYWRRIRERATVADKWIKSSGQRDSARLLAVKPDDALWESYFRYLSRAKQFAKLETARRMFRSAVSDASLFSSLHQCACSGDAERAESLIQAAETGGCAVPWSPRHFVAWLGCYQSAGDTVNADRIWAKMESLNVRPTSETYTALLQVYIRAHAGRPSHSNRIDEILNRIKPAKGGPRPLMPFTVSDYQKLLKSTHAAMQEISRSPQRDVELARAGNLMRRLRNFARAARVERQLDGISQQIMALGAAKVRQQYAKEEEWKHTISRTRDPPPTHDATTSQS
jgi:hypothetical protein